MVSTKVLLSSNRGSALAQVIVLAGIASAFGVAILSTLQAQARSNYEASLKARVISIRQSLLGTIGNYRAWANTHKHQGTMNCNSPTQYTYCQILPDQAPLEIVLRDASDRVILDSQDSKAGFTLSGEPCHTYSPEGNDACPIQVKLTWRAACTGTTCSPATVASGVFRAPEYIALNFSYSPKSKDKQIPFRPMNYNLAEHSRSGLESLADPIMACSRVGATYIGAGHSYNGHTADALGCLPFAALIGPQGPTGPKGDKGPIGPRGPAGKKAVCLDSCAVFPGSCSAHDNAPGA